MKAAPSSSKTLFTTRLTKAKKSIRGFGYAFHLFAHPQEKKGDFSGGAAIQIGLQMGEIPLNTGRRYFKNGANLFYLRMEAMDRLLYKDVFIREKGYDERCEYVCGVQTIVGTSKR